MAKKTLWQVPKICLIGGIVAHFSMIWLFGRFALVTLPDGTLTVSWIRQMIIYGLFFLAVLLVGGLAFLRKLTRREIFCSASVVVIYGSVLLFVQWALGLTTGVGAVVLLRLWLPMEWSDFISPLIAEGIARAGHVENSVNLWIGAAIQLFVPYLFILFGRPGRKAKERTEV